MKTATRFFAFLSAATVLCLVGCQKNDGNIVRRAQLIVSENIQLKKQLEDKDRQITDLAREKDAQIAALKLEIQQCQQAKQFIQEQNAEQINTSLMQMLADCSSQLGQLRGEPNLPSELQ